MTPRVRLLAIILVLAIIIILTPGSSSVLTSPPDGSKFNYSEDNLEQATEYFKEYFKN